MGVLLNQVFDKRGVLRRIHEVYAGDAIVLYHRFQCVLEDWSAGHFRKAGDPAAQIGVEVRKRGLDLSPETGNDTIREGSGMRAVRLRQQKNEFIPAEASGDVG